MCTHGKVPNSLSVRECLSLAPPTSDVPSKYGLTCKFGRFGRTPAILINSTLAKCLTPAITDNVRLILTSAK